MGSQKHSVCILDEQNEEIKAFEIGNTLEQFRMLEHYLDGKEDVRVCCEGVHGPLLEYLKSRGVLVYPVNPLKIKRFREVRALSGDKHDALDARCLAENLQTNHQLMRPFSHYSDAVEELNLLRISHDRVTKEHARYANKLIFLLREYFPLHEGLFSTAVR